MNNVVLFDGVCNLCNSSVDFLIRHEKDNVLKFASLQSDVGKQIISEAELKEVPDSVLFYKEGKLLVRSDAVLSLCTFLKSPYRLGTVLRIVPRFMREVVYKWIARNRYKWFGKRDSCRLPTQEENERFLG